MITYATHLKLWAKPFISFTDASHVKTIGGPCSLEVHTALLSLEIHKPMPDILSLENILHGFSLMKTSTISSVVLDKDSCCVVIT